MFPVTTKYIKEKNKKQKDVFYFLWFYQYRDFNEILRNRNKEWFSVMEEIELIC